MKCFILLLLFACIIRSVTAQNAHSFDSLKRALSQTKEDTNKVNLYIGLARNNLYSYPDTALFYALLGLDLAKKMDFKRGEVSLMNLMGEALSMKGNYSKALETVLKALEKAEKLNDLFLISECHNYLGAIHMDSEDYQKALFYFNKARANKQFFNIFNKYILGQIGECYIKLNKIDSAYFFTRQAYDIDLKDTNHWAFLYYHMGTIENKKGNPAKALDFYRVGNRVAIHVLEILHGYNGIASVFNSLGRKDSAIHYAKKSIAEGAKQSYFTGMLEASSLLTNIYKSTHDIDSAFKYQQIMLAAKDSLFNQEKVKLIQNLSFNEKMRQQQAVQERIQAQQQYETKVKLYSLLAGLAVLSLIAFILYRANRHKQQINALLAQQKEELQATLEDLQSTQAQLIQKEKMASLGELTAGIAHEIQNPLNFVNNFSEVNKELMDELETEIDKGNIEEVKLIINDLKENEQKVMLHGKRADSIVKGMLQHSRESSGEKQLTDINALAEEYLRLAYHGMRAKDKDFNAEFTLQADPNLGKVEVVPQEIGRVLLNLFNNAFYATAQKKIKLNGQYQPRVTVSIKTIGNKVEIRVKDNGIGIPENVKNKVFQPFFTTKPSGEGTGLGLSLSYDIITKGHGGELKVDSKEGEYTEFTISLPRLKVFRPVY